MNNTENYRIWDVTLRDGLQGEPKIVPTGLKQAVAKKLKEAGINTLELGSMVSPKLLPTMADSAELTRSLHESNIFSSVLIFNNKGLEAAIACGSKGVVIVCIISDELCYRNTRKKSEENKKLNWELLKRAKQAGLYTRLTIAPAWVCPYEGPISPDKACALAQEFAALEPDELVLADTAGLANPKEVQSLFAAIQKVYPINKLAAHFHDTKGQGLANVLAAKEQGVRIFDASLGGIGGCPYAKGAPGNVATDQVIEALGIGSCDTDKIRAIGSELHTYLHPPVDVHERSVAQAW